MRPGYFLPIAAKTDYILFFFRINGKKHLERLSHIIEIELTTICLFRMKMNVGMTFISYWSASSS